MMLVRWTDDAKRSLNKEMEFIRAESLSGAKKVYYKIREQVANLSQFPSMGRAGQIEGTRELVINGTPYIVPYRVKNNVVEIICIFHTSRKLPDAW